VYEDSCVPARWSLQFMDDAGDNIPYVDAKFCPWCGLELPVEGDARRHG
jgi:hypothetical protein